jgi:hypothetical protein
MDKLEIALRHKFRTGREALIALGIDPSLANDASRQDDTYETHRAKDKVMSRRYSRDEEEQNYNTEYDDTLYEQLMAMPAERRMRLLERMAGDRKRSAREGARFPVELSDLDRGEAGDSRRRGAMDAASAVYRITNTPNLGAMAYDSRPLPGVAERFAKRFGVRPLDRSKITPAGAR